MGNLLCNKTAHKVMCRLKPPCLRGIGFYVVAGLGEAGTSPLASRGELGREGGTPGTSWRQWVPQNCSLEGPQMGAVEDHLQRAATSTRVYQQDEAKVQAGAGGRG